MIIQSPQFENGQTIPAKFTCDGGNINPPLAFTDIVAAAKSLALIIDDPDAPKGPFTHWLIWNIPAATNRIVENTVPEGATEGLNSSGNIGYTGPCPPSGTHRYFFKLYALDEMLKIKEGTAKEELEKALQGHIVGQAELVGTYSRS